VASRDDVLLGLFFSLEDGGHTFLLNIGCFHRTLWHYNPQDKTLHKHHCENSNHTNVHLLNLYSASHLWVAPENVGLQKERTYNTFACHTCNEMRLCVLGIRKKEVGNMKDKDNKDGKRRLRNLLSAHVSVSHEERCEVLACFHVVVKMYRYSLEERVFIVKTYWITGSIKNCQRRFVQQFGGRNPPSKRYIQLLVKKLETKGTTVGSAWQREARNVGKYSA
jgi:hypothetical protein